MSKLSSKIVHAYYGRAKVTSWDAAIRDPEAYHGNLQRIIMAVQIFCMKGTMLCTHPAQLKLV